MSSLIQPRFFAGLSGLGLILGALACGGVTQPVQTQSLPAQPAADSSASSIAPAGKIPDLTLQLAWSGEPITLPAPIDPERTIYRTPQYRRWQFGGDTDEFTYVDPSGVKYVIQAVGKAESAAAPKSSLTTSGAKKSKKKKKKGKTGAMADASPAKAVRRIVISRYRVTSPTLENVTVYDHQGRLEGWTTYGPDGATRQVKVQMREREFCPGGAPLIQYVCFYEPERIRQLQVNAQNVAWQEVETGPSGNIRKHLHEVRAQADKLQFSKKR